MIFLVLPVMAGRRTAALPLAYARRSTSCLAAKKDDVDARQKAGHDDDIEIRAEC
jgi:hypothetical protein